MWKFTNKYVPNNTHGKISKFSRNNMHYLDNDVSCDCSLINWENALLVKFLILLPCNQL